MVATPGTHQNYLLWLQSYSFRIQTTLRPPKSLVAVDYSADCDFATRFFLVLLILLYLHSINGVV